VKKPGRELIIDTRSDIVDIPLVEERIVTLATLVHASAAFTAQLPKNQTADHHAATLAVSHTVNSGKSATSTRFVLSSETRVTDGEAELERAPKRVDDRSRVRMRETGRSEVGSGT
jgi:hypothetical protein